jgi:hypothetical protein
MLCLFAALALAGGTYDPDDVAARSSLFAKASDVAGTTFQDRSETASALAAALRRYETSLDLLGARAPAAERERRAAIRTAFNREFAVLQAFSDTMMDDFDAEFRAAVQRAVKGLGDVKECKREIPDGRPLPGLPARTKPNPDCGGEDLSPRIADAIDGDPKLQRAIDEILRLEWPKLTVPSQAMAVIGGGDRWVEPYALVAKAAPKNLRAIDQADEDAREAFAAAIEAGSPKEELARLKDDADRVTAATAARRSALAEPLLAASGAALAKWRKKEAASGWCANPTFLGGCVGADATAELVPRLLADAKVARAIPQ